MFENRDRTFCSNFVFLRTYILQKFDIKFITDYKSMLYMRFSKFD